MRTRRDSTDLDLGQTMPVEEMLIWNIPASIAKPEEAARKDFAETMERHRKALEQALTNLAHKGG